MGKKFIIIFVATWLAGCASSFRPFARQAPVWRDDGDFRLFGPKPPEYKVATLYDGVDETIFRPFTRLFAVDAASRARNVNSMDEVPDSSWFTNRMGKRSLSPEEVAKGACDVPLNPAGPFTILSGKPDGFNPGFLVRAPNGKRYFFKFDQHELQPERMSSAEVIGSLIYHAVGFTVPCYEVLYFDKAALIIDKEATVKNAKGEKVKMTQADVDKAFSLVKLAADGKVRAVSSLLLEGKPLGPWTYAGKNGADPNDVIAHEHRREVRAGYVLASWISHFDTRDQNTMATWMEDPISKRGYVRHNVLDFGDSLGNLADNDAISRRLGYAYYFDFPYFVEDFVTFGAIERPWDTLQFGKSGPVLGYFDVEHFEPSSWRPGYPNPAFKRMTEEDGAWMARIISAFKEAHIRAMVAKARITNAVMREDLVRILLGRREKLLRRWLGEISPLAQPEIQGGSLCVKDLFTEAGLSGASERRFRGRAWEEPSGDALGDLELTANVKSRSRICTELLNPKADYQVVELEGVSDHNPHERPLYVHLYSENGVPKIAGLER